jgi:hypothetical protein
MAWHCAQGRSDSRSAATRPAIRGSLRGHDRPLEYRPHPWHGVDPGKRFPEIVRAYIEIVPTDGVKYEIDKHSGYLMVDQPQRFSSFCPTLYGFVPRTYWRDRRHLATAAVP